MFIWKLDITNLYLMKSSVWWTISKIYEEEPQYNESSL